MAYPYYQNNQFYMQDLQNMKDRIDRQMQQMQQLNQSQMQQQPTPTNLTQNFQLAPNTNSNELESKYVNNIDEVKGIFDYEDMCELVALSNDSINRIVKLYLDEKGFK